MSSARLYVVYRWLLSLKPGLGCASAAASKRQGQRALEEVGDWGWDVFPYSKQALAERDEIVPLSVVVARRAGRTLTAPLRARKVVMKFEGRLRKLEDSTATGARGQAVDGEAAKRGPGDRSAGEREVLPPSHH